MKILMLADTMDIGGAETHILELSRSLSSVGHQIKILAGDGQTAALLASYNIGFEKTDLFSRPALSLPLAVSKLLEVLRKFKPDAVHAHTRRTLFAARLAQKTIPFPLVFTAHAKFSASAVKRIFTRPPEYTVAVSEDIRTHFSSVFGAKEICVIENGIDTERFLPAKAHGNGFKIVNVSRIDKDSSLSAELLCRLAPRLCRVCPDTEIVVVGGGNDFSRISLLAQEANREIGKTAVTAVGAKSDVLPFLREASLFVGVSRAALEAMCVGVPVIICGNEGYFGLCDLKNFDLCSKENFCARGYGRATEEQLFDEIMKARAQKEKGSLFLRGLVKERYDSKKVAVQTLEIYQKAISRHRAALGYDAVICGYYGFGNLGDELVLAQILKNLQGKRVAVIGNGGDGRIGRLSLSAASKAIRSSSLFILGGGSLLQNSTSGRSLEYYLALLRIACFYGKKIMLYANGLGPIYGERALKRCQKILSHVDIASFRDSESYSAAKMILNPNTSIRLTCDPALLIPAKGIPRKRIAIFVRGEDANEKLTRQIKNALLKFRREISENEEIFFVSMNRKRDEVTALRLSNSMPFPTKCRFFAEGEKLVEFIVSSKMVISSRLHALIVSASACRPFVALCHDPKLEAFAKDCDMPPHTMPRLNSPNFEFELFEAIKYTHTNLESIESHLKTKTEEIKKRAQQDAQAIEIFLPTDNK